MREANAGGDGLARQLVDEQFGVVDGQLAVGGMVTSELVRRYRSPLFVYDTARIRRQLERLRANLPSQIDVDPETVRRLLLCLLWRESAGKWGPNRFLGGYSLLAMRAVRAIEQATNHGKNDDNSVAITDPPFGLTFNAGQS